MWGGSSGLEVESWALNALLPIAYCLLNRFTLGAERSIAYCLLNRFTLDA